MPKRKNTKPETIDDMISELEAANSLTKDEINSVTSEEKPQDEPQDEPQDDDRKADELLKLAEDGGLDKSVAYLKKAGQKVINKKYIYRVRKETYAES